MDQTKNKTAKIVFFIVIIIALILIGMYLIQRGGSPLGPNGQQSAENKIPTIDENGIPSPIDEQATFNFSKESSLDSIEKDLNSTKTDLP